MYSTWANVFIISLVVSLQSPVKNRLETTMGDDTYMGPFDFLGLDYGPKEQNGYNTGGKDTQQVTLPDLATFLGLTRLCEAEAATEAWTS